MHSPRILDEHVVTVCVPRRIGYYQEAGGQKPRVLSIDDYYMTEVTEEKTDERGLKRKMAVMKYQHDDGMEEVTHRRLLRVQIALGLRCLRPR